MKKKNTGIRLLLLFCMCLMIWQNPVITRAAEEGQTEEQLEMIGGQIRIVEPMGLRFVASIQKEYLAELEKQGTVEYGILILPEKYLNGQDLTIDGKYLYNGKIYKPAVVPAKKIFSEKENEIYFTAVLVNLGKERYKESYAAKPYVKITKETEQENGEVEVIEELEYGDNTIERQVYEVAENAIAGNIETEETKEWLQENIIDATEKPDEPTEEEKNIPFQLGKVKMVTLYKKNEDGTVGEVSQFNRSEFNKEDYLVKAEVQGQPEIFADIKELIEEDGQVSFRLKLDNFVTGAGVDTKSGPVVPFGKVQDSQVTTSYMTMQALIDKLNNSNENTVIELEHDMDASQISIAESLVGTFKGTLDGKGHKITGLSSTLFGKLEGATVRNLVIENASVSTVSSNNYKGILANQAGNDASANRPKETLIENVHVSGTITSRVNQTGGLVGRFWNSTIQKCSANVKIDSTGGSVGGLIGEDGSKTGTTRIEDSYAIGTITSNGVNIGGIAGKRTLLSIERCYAAVDMKSNHGTNRVGGVIGNAGQANGGNIQHNVSYSVGGKGYKFDGMSAQSYLTANYQNNYTLRESNLEKDSNRLGSAANGKITEKTMEELSTAQFYTNMGWSTDTWNFEPLKEGKTPTLKTLDPNMTAMLEVQGISTVEDLKKIKDNLNGRYELQADLDVSSVTLGTAIIPGTFTGTFRGNGHTITGQKMPLFETLSEAVVERLTLQGGEIVQKDKDNMAALAKTAQKDTLLSNIYVRGVKVEGGSHAAGLVSELNQTEVKQCSVRAEVNGAESGGFAAKILNQSVITDSYSRRTLTLEEVTGMQGGFAAVVNNSTLSRNYSELQIKEEKQETEKPETEAPESQKSKTAEIGIFIGNSGTGTEKPVQIEKNIGFGPKGYSFKAQPTETTDLDTFTGNFEYTDENLLLKEGTQQTGKIDQAQTEQVVRKEFYTETLGWDSAVWYLEDVVGGKRPRLVKEGEVYEGEGSEKPEGGEEAPQIKPETETISLLTTEETVSISEEPEKDSNAEHTMEVVQKTVTPEQEAEEQKAVQTQETEPTPEESVQAVAARNAEERAAYDDLTVLEGYQANRKLIYENLQVLMPFYVKEQIIKDGNKVSTTHVLNQKKVLTVYPLDTTGKRMVALTKEGAEKVKQIRIQFEDNETKPLIYNVTHIDTRSNIASYGISQLPVHYNYNKYVVDTQAENFQTVLNAAKGYEFDRDIESRVSQKDLDSVIHSYRRNYTEVVSKEMEQIIISMAANNPQFPMNRSDETSKILLKDMLLDSGYLKDFLYGYNYADRWYDFEIGGVNMRDVVLFDNSLLHTGRTVRNIAVDITKNTSNTGRQGNSTQSVYESRIAPSMGLNTVAAFVEYFMSAYAGYEDVNDWIIDNFKGGIIVEARANNPKIDSRLWRILKNNTVHKNQQMILPTLSYKTSKNLYLASFPTSLVYGNLQIYDGYQDTDAWRERKRQELVNQLSNYRNIYDNFVEVAANGANSVNQSKFLIVDSSFNRDRSQDVFIEYYKQLGTLWGSKNGAVAVVFGNPNQDYIYYNSDRFINDITILNHEMGHVTDMWIWLENKGKRPGRNGEDYSNGFANQATLDYNMNFMKDYPRDGGQVSNLTPERINSQEEFKSYYKEVFDTIYTLDYLQGLAYLQLSPDQQAQITAQHHYGTKDHHQTANSANSTWAVPSQAQLESMNLQTLEDLWDNQITIRPGQRYDISSQVNVGINNFGAYQIDKLSYSSWYVPYVEGATPNAQTFRRNGFELAGMYGYSDGLVEYLSNRTKTGDLAFYKKITNDPNFSFEKYRKNKNKEIEEKIKAQEEQGNPYFDADALIAYFKKNLINYGNGIHTGVSTGNNTLQNIKESRENVFRYLQRITDEFRSPVYSENAGDRKAVTISTAQEFVEKISANPNGFYVLANDISMADINPQNGVYVDKTFIGKLEAKGYEITDASVPLFRKISNSYVSDLVIKNGQADGKLAQTEIYTIRVNEMEREKEISTLEELQGINKNDYTRYKLTQDIDASSVTGEAVIGGSFSSVLDGNGHTIKGLKAPLFEKIDHGTVQNLNIRDAEINRNGQEYAAALAKRTNHATIDTISLENVKLIGSNYAAALVGYDYTGSVFSKIQVRNAKVETSGFYSSAFIGRATGSKISDVAVLESSVKAVQTENGGFAGSASNVEVRNVFSDTDLDLTGYKDAQDRKLTAGFIGRIIGDKNKIENTFAAGDVIYGEGETFYKFTSTKEVINTGISNSYELSSAKGETNVTEETARHLQAATEENKKDSNFYIQNLGLNEETWNLSLVGLKGYPELKGMEKKEVLPVRTAEDLKNISKYPTQEYYLEADIDLSEEEQQGVFLSDFSGVLDGKNHKITGLKVPLVGELSGEVKNLAIDNAAVTTPQNQVSGILATAMKGAKVSNVAVVNGSITAQSTGAAGFAGSIEGGSLKDILVYNTNVKVQGGKAAGFAGSISGAALEGIVSYAEVEAADNVQAAGFAVENDGTGTVKKVLAAGDVPANAPKFMSNISNVENGYELNVSQGTPSADKAHVTEIGEEIYKPEFYTNTLKLNSENWTAEKAAENGYPTLKSFTLNTEPFKIRLKTAADMALLNKMPSGKFILEQDLDFTEVKETLVTESFTGSLQGNGHSITGLSSPLFTELAGTVENLHFKNVLVKDSAKGANVLAVTGKGANVSQVFFNGITMQGQGHTGIVGTDAGSTFSHIGIENVQMQAQQEYAGILLGEGNGTRIENLVLARAEVKTESSYVGGLAGKLQHAALETVFSDVSLYLPPRKNVEYAAGVMGSVGENGNTVNHLVSAGGVYPADMINAKYKTVYIPGNPYDAEELKGFRNSFENTDTPGESLVNTSAGIEGVSEAELRTADFYTGKMALSEEIWSLEGIETRGYPRLKNMDKDNLKPPAIEKPPVQEENPLESTVPEGYTAITTAEELLAIANNPSGKYILMKPISLYGYEPKSMDSFLGDFSGELKGNGLTISDVYHAPLFSTFRGTVTDLKVRDVKVERFQDNEQANAFAKKLSSATVKRVAFYDVLLAGGNLTGTLAGTTDNSVMEEIWAENLDINPYGPSFGYFPTHIYSVGGLLGQLEGNNELKNSYVSGEMFANGSMQGGVIGCEAVYNSSRVENVISNMRMKTTQWQSDLSKGGFIGSLQVAYSPWLINSISIGDAGADSTIGSDYNTYKFTGTRSGSGISTGVENCYESKDSSGERSVYENSIAEIDKAGYHKKEFYKDTLKFTSEFWNFSTVEEKGYPVLNWIGGKEENIEPEPEPDPDTEGEFPEVQTYPRLEENVPPGYIGIYTAEDLMKISDDPFGNYILMNNIALDNVHAENGSYIDILDFGELNGNNQVISGLKEGALFGTISEGSVNNLRIQNVRIDNGTEQANVFAKTINGAMLDNLQFSHIELKGGSKTAVLAGMSSWATMNGISIENMNITVQKPEGANAEDIGGIAGVFGAGNMMNDIYVEGTMHVNGAVRTGGIAGSSKNMTNIKQAISNVRVKGSEEGHFNGGFLGDSDGNININNSFSMSDTSVGETGAAGYKFYGRPLTDTDKVTNCYELSSAGGLSSVTDTTASAGKLMTTDRNHEESFFSQTLGFSSGIWDFSGVTQKGYPSLLWFSRNGRGIAEELPVEELQPEEKSEDAAEPFETEGEAPESESAENTETQEQTETSEENPDTDNVQNTPDIPETVLEEDVELESGEAESREVPAENTEEQGAAGMPTPDNKK